MKKILPLTVLALAAVTAACSSDDDKGTPDFPTTDAISFAKPFINNSIKERTPQITNANFSEFKVYGFVNRPNAVVFEGTTVRKQPDGTWTYKPEEYWHRDQSYYFTGIAPDSAAIRFIPLTGEEVKVYTGGGTITLDNTKSLGKLDLVAAFSNEVVASEANISKAVALTFGHKLSQITFNFVNKVSNSTKLVIKDIKMIGLPESGRLDLAAETPTWEATPGQTLEQTVAETTKNGKFDYGANDDTENNPFYIIPTTGTPYKVSFIIEVYNGTSKTPTATYNKEVTLPLLDFVMGNSYRFTANITHDNLGLTPIEFTAQEEQWIPAQTPDIDVPVKP